MNNQRFLLKAGGICGLILSISQLAGILLHGSIPADPGEGLLFIQNHVAWGLTHIILISSYFSVVGFYVGFQVSFREQNAMVQIAGYMILVGAFLGALHFTIHYTVFTHAAAQFQNQGSNSENIILYYHSFHHYAHLLNRYSLFIMMVVELIFSISLLKEDQFKRWLGKLGMFSSILVLIAIPVIEIFLPRRTGDLVFAGVILPVVVWIFCMGLAFLKKGRKLAS
jgi:hypothetical protein